MNPAPGPSDYRSTTGDANGLHQSTVTDQLSGMVETAQTAASDAVAEIKERPYAAIAIAGGLAFAFGALWMLRRHRAPSRLDQLMAQLPDMPSRSSLMKAWR